jgi:hypothetical protein
MKKENGKGTKVEVTGKTKEVKGRKGMVVPQKMGNNIENGRVNVGK